jgi:bifunctional non-homologous end joining protein LigD
MKAVMERKKAPKRSRGAGSTTPASGNALVADGKRVSVTNLDKVLYPEVGFTKGQVIDYFIRIAPVVLRHVRDRPLTLKRYPNGVDKPFFYQKHCPEDRPEWVETAAVWSEQNQEEIRYCVANNLPTLVWLGNLADLELHTSLARRENVDCPTMVMFDLDPGAPAAVLECADVALWLKRVLDKLGLECFVKTSGSKGLQVCIPLNTPTNYDATKTFAKKIADSFEEQNPGLVVAKMNKELRKGRVFIDWSQNDRHKTTVCVYSLRAMASPRVSTPLKWNEVEAAFKKKDATKLSFLSDEVLRRVEKHGDLFAPVLELKQKLPAL